MPPSILFFRLTNLHLTINKKMHTEPSYDYDDFKRLLKDTGLCEAILPCYSLFLIALHKYLERLYRLHHHLTSNQNNFKRL